MSDLDDFVEELVDLCECIVFRRLDLTKLVVQLLLLLVKFLVDLLAEVIHETD
jgi:hypothetical protein